MTSRISRTTLACATALPLILMACEGDDGSQGPAGPAGPGGADGSNSLVVQTLVAAGDAQCFQGGIRFDSGLDTDGDGTLGAGEITDTSFQCNATSLNLSENFVRVASYPVCAQDTLNGCNAADAEGEAIETAAEIVDVSADGQTLIYSDSPLEALGFIDIPPPDTPVGLGVLTLPGEPTSVAVKGGFALVGINSSADFVNTSGSLAVVDIATQSLVTSLDLGGQPDSVAVSPDGAYAVVAIENERDEDLGDGRVGQAPAGFVVIADISDADPANWTTSSVDVTGLADVAPDDPEPEFVDINSDNVAVVTLQENNHLVLIDLATATVTNSFSAGAVDLTNVDATEEDPAIISQTESLAGVVREPDGVAWINSTYFATADEGDMDGGSRGFTIYSTGGDVAFTSGNDLEHLTARIGHYPDGRSENKGNEPENVEVGVYGEDRYLFVNSERSSVIAVYDVADPTRPVFKQVLPAGAGPEGGKAIPSRGLLAVASEEDARDDKIRSVINIYSYAFGGAAYPTITSTNRENGAPIPWAAMSGLAADPSGDVLYAIEDSFYGSNRIFAIDISEEPALLTEEITISDANDVFANAFGALPTADLPDAFDQGDLAALINADKTVNIDPEGISVASDGGFWIASEGAGTQGEPDTRPITSLNFIFKTDAAGVIEDVITLPDSVNAIQVRFGFEGVAEFDGSLYVAIQRAWGGEFGPRLGVYDLAAETWEFAFYPLDAVESPNGGWVGLSDITALGGGEFLVVERDNQGGPDAAIKRLYQIDFDTFGPDGEVFKTLVRDLVAEGDLTAPGGLIYEKIEGSAVTTAGDVYIINDNDGVDDNSGETQLINLGPILP